jgi:hypothetical protein
MKSRPFLAPVLSLFLTAVLACAGCEDDPLPAAPPITPDRVDGGGDGASDGAGTDGAAADLAAGDGGDGASDGGAGDGAAADPLWARPAPVGMALVNGDRQSVSISLVALGGGALTTDACFGSGSADPQLSAALSGDVVLPSDTQPGNELVVIDRTNSVLTWINPATCQVRRQLNVGNGFAANPHDLVAGLGGPKGYVTRYGRNSARTDQGSDILIIDTERGQATGRIDLTGHASASPTPGKVILPMPSRMAVVGKRVYVALNNLSEAYDAAGVGRVLVIDATNDTVVETIDLPTLKNCGSLTRFTTPGGEALAVSCAGPYSDNAQQIDTAGVAIIDLARTPAEVKVIRSTGFGRPLSGFDLEVVEPAIAFTVVNGDGAMLNDAVWMFSLAGGTPQKIFDAGGSYVLSLSLDRARRTLYLLEAAKISPKVHLYTVPVTGAPTRSGELVASPRTGLPPRMLSFY